MIDRLAHSGARVVNLAGHIRDRPVQGDQLVLGGNSKFVLFTFHSAVNSFLLTVVNLFEIKQPVNRKVNRDVEYLKAARKRLGWNQEELAKALGLDRSYLSQLENGREIQPWVWERLEVIERGVKAGVDKSTACREESTAPGSPLEMQCREYLDDFLQTCHGDAAHLGWTLVELKKKFPLDLWAAPGASLARHEDASSKPSKTERYSAETAASMAVKESAAPEGRQKLRADESTERKS